MHAGRLEHDQDTGMGQNLFQKTAFGTRIEVSGQEVVDAWYGEIRSYDFTRPGFTSGTGHFTQVLVSNVYSIYNVIAGILQVVWVGTTHVGVATATQGNTVFVVANYTPPGNFVGSQNFSVNVKKQT